MERTDMKQNMPTVALRGMTILPHTIIHFDLSRKKSISAVEQAMVESQKIFLITQKEAEKSDPEYEDVYHIGTIALVKQIIKMPNHIVRVMVEGLSRGGITLFHGKGRVSGRGGRRNRRAFQLDRNRTGRGYGKADERTVCRICGILSENRGCLGAPYSGYFGAGLFAGSDNHQYAYLL